ncbi:hypothetical protein MCOR32_010311 [Pyricularia oryzae]|nr:hypothetical protein MCOR32_010311 [Pyricularia oryzae]KAI6595637.1 hypothetical protein MCOR12_006474 [Pyricularia oryzae]
MAPSSNLLLSFFFLLCFPFCSLVNPGRTVWAPPQIRGATRLHACWDSAEHVVPGARRARLHRQWWEHAARGWGCVSIECRLVYIQLGRPAVPLPLFPATARDGKELRGLTGTLLCPCPGLLEREKARKNRLGKVLDFVPNYIHPNASKGKCASRPSDLVHAGFWSRKQAFLLVIIDVLQQAPGLGNWPGDHCNFKTSVSASKNWTLRQATSPVVPLSIGKEVSLYLTPRRHQRVRCSLEKSRPGDFDGDRVGAEKGAGWLAKLLAG